MLLKRIAALMLSVAIFVSALSSCSEADNDQSNDSSASDESEQTVSADDDGDESGGKNAGGAIAGIFLPAMLGYSKDSKLATANSCAKAVYNVMINYCQQCLNYDKPVSDGVYIITISPNADEIAYNGAVSDFEKAIGQAFYEENAGSIAQVKILNGFPISVTWSKTASDPYVGRYPNAATDRNAALE